MIGRELQFETPAKTIIQKGNALLGLGQFDVAKECYESLREQGENSAADQNLKKLDDIQEKDINSLNKSTLKKDFQRCELFWNSRKFRFISQNKFPKPAAKPQKKKKLKR